MAKKSTRRGNNEGCISKRKDGGWVGVVTLGTARAFTEKPNRK